MAESKLEIGKRYRRELKAFIKEIKKGNEQFPLRKINGEYRVNKTQLANKLGMGRSVWSQNPRALEILEKAESELLSLEIESKNESSVSNKNSEADRQLQQRITVLENKLAALLVENNMLASELERRDMDEKLILEYGTSVEC